MADSDTHASRRRAIVTGSDSGIGRATAVALACEGFDLGITWHEDGQGAQDTADEVERHYGARTVVERLDLADASAAGAAADALIEGLGGVDVFVNNAGGAATHPFLEYPLEDWRAAIDVNLTGTFVCAQRAARAMVRAGGGAIVNVTSVHEHIPLRDSAGYCAAKAGIGLLTKVMAIELAEHGITVNAVAPGEIATAMTGNEDVDPHEVERAMIPAGRPGHAKEIASAIVYLASEGARYVTGESFVIDGGLNLMGAEANRIVGEG